MKVIIDKESEKVLYGSNIEIEAKENEIIVDVEDPSTIKNHYDLKTETFYHVEPIEE